MELNGLVASFLALGGVAAFVTFGVNFGKAVGVVKDDDAGKWSTGLNLVGLVAFFALGIVDPELDMAGLDKELAAFVDVAVVVFAYIMQLIESKTFHKLLSWAGIPVIGKSNS